MAGSLCNNVSNVKSTLENRCSCYSYNSHWIRTGIIVQAKVYHQTHCQQIATRHRINWNIRQLLQKSLKIRQIVIITTNSRFKWMLLLWLCVLHLPWEISMWFTMQPGTSIVFYQTFVCVFWSIFDQFAELSRKTRKKDNPILWSPF